MVRRDTRKTKILGSIGVILCILAVALITWTLLQEPATINSDVLPEEADETIDVNSAENETVVPEAKTGARQKILYVLYRAENLFGIIDGEKNETRKEIAVGKSPQEMFFDEAADRMYITNQISSTITVIDLKKEEVTQTFKAGNSPEGIVVTKEKIYVTNPSENTVVVIDKKLGFISKEIAVGSDPGPMLLSEDQRKIYVLNRGSNDITIINTAIDAFIDTWFAGDQPEQFAISPHERFIYVTSPTGVVTILPIRQPREYREMRVGLGASQIAFSPNNVLSAIANTDDNTLSLTSLTREMLLATIDVGVAPSDVVITADAKTAYVSNSQSNTISIIDLRQKQRVAEFPVNKDPRRIILRESKK